MIEIFRSVHFDDGKLTVENHEYLRKHDIVYQTPAYKGCDGLPIGNGDIGGMLYHSESSIILGINKTDAIDFAPDGNFEAWSWRAEEANTAPVSCGKITISDSMPSFDWLYLKEYSEVLSLAEGVVNCSSRTAFSSYNYRAYVSKPSDVIVFEVSAESFGATDSNEAVERRVMLEKWGSINLFHDYEQIRPDYEKNLFNIKVGNKDNTVYLEQNLRGTSSITAMRVSGARIESQNSRSIGFVLEKSSRHDFTVLITVITAHEGSADLDEAIDILDKAENDRLLYDKHKAQWVDFWSKSLICIPGNDYLENIYYMNLYQLGSCGLGAYPVTFAGLWGWFADTRNWGHYYHWNHQQTYWGCYPTGHYELAINYLDYRFGMLNNAKADAKRLYGTDNGAFFSDITNFNGYNALEPDTIRNFTPTAQIALDFYRYYQYTMDKDFLYNKALPVMQAAAELYISLLAKEDKESGAYRIKGGSTCYESYWNLKETITDFASIHMLFDALIDISEVPGASGINTSVLLEIKDRLYAFPTTHTEHNGKEYEVISPGVKWNGQAVATAEGDYPLSPFPLCELSAIYPSGYIGLSKLGTKQFEIALSTARLLFDMDIYSKSKIGSCGHSVAAETAARLGMREDCLRIIRLFVERYQQFPNGLTHFVELSDRRFRQEVVRPRILGADTDTEWRNMHEKSIGPRGAVPSDYSMHCYFESAGNIMAGINEMLLQSHDGIIRVFPAVEPGFTGCLTLCATGGFSVTSEICDGDILYVYIKSPYDNLCRLESPWPNEALRITTGGKDMRFEIIDTENVDSGIIQFQAASGAGYLLTRCEFPLECFYVERIKYSKNTAPKEYRGKVLGRYGYFNGR